MLLRPAVLHRVVHGLLGDVKQMRRHPDILKFQGIVTREAAGDVAQVLDLVGQRSQR